MQKLFSRLEILVNLIVYQKLRDVLPSGTYASQIAIDGPDQDQRVRLSGSIVDDEDDEVRYLSGLLSFAGEDDFAAGNYAVGKFCGILTYQCQTYSVTGSYRYNTITFEEESK